MLSRCALRSSRCPYMHVRAVWSELGYGITPRLREPACGPPRGLDQVPVSAERTPQSAINGVKLYQIHRFEVGGFRGGWSSVSTGV